MSSAEINREALQEIYPSLSLGCFIRPLSCRDLAQDNGMPENLKGVYVDRITENGPADKAGIHGSTIDQYLKKHLGDVIIAMNLKATSTARPSLIPFLTTRSVIPSMPHPPIRPPTGP